MAIALLCAPLAGWAQEAAPAPAQRAGDSSTAAPPPTSDRPEAAKPPAQPGGQPSLDFDLLDETPKPDAAAQAAHDAEVARVEQMVKRRRSMLTLHQGLGLVTLASLAATTVVGQLELNDKYRGGGDTERWLPLHVGLLTTTSALFATVGLLGVLAPVPYPKQFRLDTANIHKFFMALATAGMVAQLVLGLVTHGSDGHLYQVDLVTAHQIIGYGTLGAMTAGAVTLFF